ncbi:lantibiotic dehydratase [Algoriphagus yeomjeoni]|uniref:lantibiotic dehydratase n=1 Tax=Algoriphagus yeomjeoni TaxID=291403 RepID=UPI003CE49591
MSFLYRLPLFHFDHEQDAVLDQQWNFILSAIKLSSIVFHRELEGKTVSELTHKQRVKLRKYLLRGRYRPTPFGRFAGVGLGSWAKEITLDFPVQASEITQGHADENSKPSEFPADPLHSNYKLIPGIQIKQKHYHALIFDHKSRSWKGCKLPVNPLFDALLKTMSTDSINFTKFQQLISPKQSGISGEEAKLLWNQVLSSGFLFPENPIKDPTSGVDTVVKNRLNLPETLREQLQRFTSSVGSLFSKEETRYIRDFKKFFTTQFDDRHILLNELMTHNGFLSGQFLQDDTVGKEDDIISAILSKHTQASIDLQQFFPAKDLDTDIHDVQLLFRLDTMGNPIIENIVCNRPFVYTGRFNRNPEIKTQTQRIKNRIFIDPEVMYAHVQLLESAPIQHICNVDNIFAYEITPFEAKEPSQLAFNELYIGIRDTRIQLIHKHTGRQVVPVILHPLNGEQITHPILRLLWETAHQCRFRFLPYQSSTLSQLPYCPQLNWGKICLQSRKWKLKKSNVPSLSALGQRLDQLQIPPQVLAGHTDRELLLNRYIPEDLKILWQELQRDKMLTLNDPAWYPSGLFHSDDGTAAFPQFVFQLSRPQPSHQPLSSFNPITHTRKNCICFTSTVNPTELPEALERLVYFMGEPQVHSRSPLWFYLLYGKNGATEIRLRVLDINEEDRKVLLLLFSEFFFQNELNWKTAPYFPETAKYGVKGLETSHQLFHLESLFLSDKSSGMLYLNYPAKYREDLLVQLWRNIFSQSPYLSSIFESLKSDVKRMPFESVKEYKSSFNPYKTMKTSEFNSFKYLEIITGHEHFHAEEDSSLSLVFNHLHMMVNRFFPLETLNFERRIKYRLYREIGREIYAHEQGVQAE